MIFTVLYRKTRILDIVILSVKNMRTLQKLTYPAKIIKNYRLEFCKRYDFHLYPANAHAIIK